MGKKDKEKTPKKAQGEEDAGGEAAAAEAIPYATRVKFCSLIAKPLADEKLCKKVHMALRFLAPSRFPSWTCSCKRLRLCIACGRCGCCCAYSSQLAL